MKNYIAYFKEYKGHSDGSLCVLIMPIAEVSYHCAWTKNHSLIENKLSFWYGQ